MNSDIGPILARHPGLLHRARFARFSFELRSSQERLQVTVDGTSIEARPGDGAARCDFTLEADADAWAQFAQAMPRPGYQDVVALIEARHARFSGDGLAFFRNLFLVRGIVSAVFTGDARW